MLDEKMIERMFEEWVEYIYSTVNLLNKKIQEVEQLKSCLFQMQEAAKNLEQMYSEKNSMWIREKVEKVSLRISLEEITRPFPSSLTLDDLAEHSRLLREKHKLDAP